MTPERTLEAEFQSLRDDLVAKYDELGMRASGEFDRATYADSRRLTASLWAPSYIEQLANGRAPGKFPPIAAIEQWIHDKGIQAVDITVSSLAFLIARKIAREGTEYFKQGGTELIEAVITPERVQGIINKVSRFYITEFELNVFNELKRLAA